MFIGAARLGNTRGMIVGENERGGVMMQRALQHFARVNARLVQRPVKQFLGGDHPILLIAEDADENFLLTRLQPQPQIVASCIGRTENITMLQTFAQRAASDFHESQDLCVLRLAPSRDGTEIGFAGAEQAGEAAKALQRRAR